MRLKLNYDEPLSNLAFNFNVRRYNMAWHKKGLLSCFTHHRSCGNVSTQQ